MMNGITKGITKIEASKEKIDLESEIIELLKYGKPKLSYLIDGWHCWIEMNTNAEGTNFEVKSEFGLSSPSEALLQCKHRAKKAVETIKNG